MTWLRSTFGLSHFFHQRASLFLRNQPSKASISCSSVRTYSSKIGETGAEKKLKAKDLLGPSSLASAALFAATGLALLWYLKDEKKKLAVAKELRKVAEETSIGKPLIGGPFELIDHDEQPFTHLDLEGKFHLLYFGFTRCPDVCPDELEKMTKVLEILDKDSEVRQKAGLVKPIFITCDPLRDSPEAIKKYLKGLTGSIEAVAKTCKAYRVYFSKPPRVNPGEDYLVDHSIFFYLMDPAGQFVNCFGKDRSAEDAAAVIKGHILSYQPQKSSD